ncbi:glucose 1-dehydrogenase [Paracraurococcus lichenis]|uniref:Glucose 1-dehydrogenase n=1 Tax=Paracraurococcus lichenis TaxID=3064888 RepID=A0ABT9DUV9_9PROT|nr:glucose 1-dehydrogenase [Paracraurococcus sp. LOR1-02]MDO9707689.1 glucose 1-dehydrogenase [Paracraurococcus sp. LOR1-02]
MDQAERLLRPLAGQVALVTGGSSGIGAGVVQALAAAGAAVAVNYASHREAAEEAARRIEAAGGRAIAVGADVAEEAAVDAMVAQVTERFGRLDILVANSGLQRDAAFRDMSLADWRKVIDVNLTGQFLCCRAALRRFLAQEERPDLSRARGKIICMSSVHEVIPWAGHANYAASKGGIMLMMKSLAQEVAPQRIRVNAIAPGAIRTPINREAWETKEAERRLLELIPYGRVGEPEDIAAAAVWLASDASDYVTGTTLFVDGGMTLYPGFADNG